MNILTFDIEEWFHILDNASTKHQADWAGFEPRLEQNMERIFSLLEAHRLKATFFCLGWVAREFPHVVRRIVELGHEVATHSDLHQLAYEQDHATFAEDLRTSIESLQDATGVKIRSYRAPGFSLKQENSWVFDVLIEHGIEVDCSVFPARRAHGGFAQFAKQSPCIVKCAAGQIREFPINTIDVLGRPMVFSGGGFFRLLPYPMVRSCFRNSDYVMTYFHPRDFDPQQPVIEGLSAFRRFKSYYGLGRAEEKLAKIIAEFSFESLASAEAKIDWTSVPVVEV